MWKLLTPPAYKAEQTGPEADARYKKLRWQVFLGIFIGYAGFYVVRKNFSMATPMLANFGFDKGELGIVLSMNAIAYGFDHGSSFNALYDCTNSMDRCRSQVACYPADGCA